MATGIATADTMSESQDFSGVKRVRSANVGQLTKLYNELEKNMTSYDNIQNVKQLYGKLCDRFEQFVHTFTMFGSVHGARCSQ